MKEQWPPPVELEKWLMNTVKETDEGAIFLRRMLNMNPAYGAYLSKDQGLAEIVKVFARRFRAKIMSAENPIQPATLYEPLCEVAWRVSGHVLHSILDLKDVESTPLPKEAIGQVKMLLQTNVELSRKFNEMRRAYLRELTEHRDRQRDLTQKQKELLHDLKEEPIMFYEPLEFVLDDTTKEFVREVVEERVKLGFRASAAKKKAGKEEETQELDVEELKASQKQALQEAKQLRVALAKEKDARKRVEDLLRRAREEAEQERNRTAEVQLQLEEAQQEIVALKDEIESLTMAMQSQGASDIAGKEALLKAQAERQQGLRAVQEKLALAEDRVAQLEQEKKELAAELAKARHRIELLESGGDEELTALREQARQDAEAARHLRERLTAMENANKKLRELAAEAAEAAAPEPAEPAAPVMVVAGGVSEEELNEAVAKASREYELKIKALQMEIKRVGELQDELERGGGDDSQKKSAEKVAALKEQIEELKAKLQDKDDKYNDLADEHERLQDHVKKLMAKLEELGAKDFVDDMKGQINLGPLEGRKRKKQNAFDRLYHDAQRRILDMRAKATSAARSEEASLVEAVKLVRDKAALRQAEALRMLQVQHNQTRSRFHDALTKFANQHGGGPAAGGGEVRREEPGEGEDDSAAVGAAHSDASYTAAFQALERKAQEMGEDLSPVELEPDLEDVVRLRQENEDLREQVQRLTALLAQELGAGKGGSNSAQRAVARMMRAASKTGVRTAAHDGGVAHARSLPEARPYSAGVHGRMERNDSAAPPAAGRKIAAVISPFAAAFMDAVADSSSAASASAPVPAARRRSMIAPRSTAGLLMDAPQILEDQDLVGSTRSGHPGIARDRAPKVPRHGVSEEHVHGGAGLHSASSSGASWRQAAASHAGRSGESFWSSASEASAARPRAANAPGRLGSSPRDTKPFGQQGSGRRTASPEGDATATLPPRGRQAPPASWSPLPQRDALPHGAHARAPSGPAAAVASKLDGGVARTASELPQADMDLLAPAGAAAASAAISAVPPWLRGRSAGPAERSAGRQELPSAEANTEGEAAAPGLPLRGRPALPARRSPLSQRSATLSVLPQGARTRSPSGPAEANPEGDAAARGRPVLPASRSPRPQGVTTLDAPHAHIAPSGSAATLALELKRGAGTASALSSAETDDSASPGVSASAAVSAVPPWIRGPSAEKAPTSQSSDPGETPPCQGQAAASGQRHDQVDQAGASPRLGDEAPQETSASPAPAVSREGDEGDRRASSDSPHDRSSAPGSGSSLARAGGVHGHGVGAGGSAAWDVPAKSPAGASPGTSPSQAPQPPPILQQAAAAPGPPTGPTSSPSEPHAGTPRGNDNHHASVESQRQLSEVPLDATPKDGRTHDAPLVPAAAEVSGLDGVVAGPASALQSAEANPEGHAAAPALPSQERPTLPSVPALPASRSPLPRAATLDAPPQGVHTHSTPSGSATAVAVASDLDVGVAGTASAPPSAEMEDPASGAAAPAALSTVPPWIRGPSVDAATRSPVPQRAPTSQRHDPRGTPSHQGQPAAGGQHQDPAGAPPRQCDEAPQETPGVPATADPRAGGERDRMASGSAERASNSPRNGGPVSGHDSALGRAGSAHGYRAGAGGGGGGEARGVATGSPARASPGTALSQAPQPPPTLLRAAPPRPVGGDAWGVAVGSPAKAAPGATASQSPQSPPAMQRAAAPSGPPDRSYYVPKPSSNRAVPHRQPGADVACPGRLPKVALDALPQGAVTLGTPSGLVTGAVASRLDGGVAGPVSALPSAEMESHLSAGAVSSAALSAVSPWLRGPCADVATPGAGSQEPPAERRQGLVASASERAPDFGGTWRGRHKTGDLPSLGERRSSVPAGGGGGGGAEDPAPGSPARVAARRSLEDVSHRRSPALPQGAVTLGTPSGLVTGAVASRLDGGVAGPVSALPSAEMESHLSAGAVSSAALSAVSPWLRGPCADVATPGAGSQEPPAERRQGLVASASERAPDFGGTWRGRHKTGDLPSLGERRSSVPAGGGGGGGAEDPAPGSPARVAARRSLEDVSHRRSPALQPVPEGGSSSAPVGKPSATARTGRSPVLQRGRMSPAFSPQRLLPGAGALSRGSSLASLPRGNQAGGGLGLDVKVLSSQGKLGTMA
ncbi:unnamed protein product [Prorocentrum cordatum]|uniref:Centrosomal protein of 70 kDa n=1 Tax=Prorocentrum cordatum TaxID=2364126 RepID=A0ABN9S324_9DINO|nr:unnamed protein product [Polarella glacialis]